MKTVTQQYHDNIGDGLRKRIKELEKENNKLKVELSQAEEDYRKLENELAEQIDGGNGLRDEIEYWKRKYKELEEKYNKFLDSQTRWD